MVTIFFYTPPSEPKNRGTYYQKAGDRKPSPLWIWSPRWHHSPQARADEVWAVCMAAPSACEQSPPAWGDRAVTMDYADFRRLYDARETGNGAPLPIPADFWA